MTEKKALVELQGDNGIINMITTLKDEENLYFVLQVRYQPADQQHI